MRKSKSKGKFTILGRPLEDLPMTDAQVPIFLPVICNFLTENRHQVGIFRKCGNFEVVQELGVLCNDADFAIPPAVLVDDASSFLKEWLRKLPTPLVTPTVFNKYYDSSAVPESVVRILGHLPVTNRRCLAMILALIQFVIDLAPMNKMTVENVAICFVPSLFQNWSDYREMVAFDKFLEACIGVMNGEGDDFAIPEEAMGTQASEDSDLREADPDMDRRCPLMPSSSQPVFEQHSKKRSFGVWRIHKNTPDVRVVLDLGLAQIPEPERKKHKRRHKSIGVAGSDEPEERHKKKKKHRSKKESD